ARRVSLEADVAAGGFPDRVDRRLRAVRAGYVDEAVATHPRTHRDVDGTRERPDFLAGLEVVGADLAHAVDEDLRLAVDRVDRRRAPPRHAGPRDAPDLPPAPAAH